MNLSAAQDSGRLTFVDATTHLEPRDGPVPSTLRDLFTEVRSALQSKAGERILVVVDDLALTEWIGIPVQELARFARALSALCRQVCF